MSLMLTLLPSIQSVYSSITLIGVHEHALEDKLRLLKYSGMNANIITNGENNRIKKLLQKYKDQVKKTKFVDKNEINNILQKIKRTESTSEIENNESNINVTTDEIATKIKLFKVIDVTTGDAVGTLKMCVLPKYSNIITTNSNNKNYSNNLIYTNINNSEFKKIIEENIRPEFEGNNSEKNSSNGEHDMIEICSSDENEQSWKKNVNTKNWYKLKKHLNNFKTIDELNDLVIQKVLNNETDPIYTERIAEKCNKEKDMEKPYTEKDMEQHVGVFDFYDNKQDLCAPDDKIPCECHENTFIDIIEEVVKGESNNIIVKRNDDEDEKDNNGVVSNLLHSVMLLVLLLV